MTNQEFIESIRLKGEEWRDVVGYEGDYIVSSYGRIAVVREEYMYRRNGRIFYKKMSRHICSTSISPSTNYRRISFMKGCKKETKLVHRVVAEAFIPNPNNYSCIDHIDDNPGNNRVDNLQWCNHKMNNSKPRHRLLGSRAKLGRIDPKRKPLVQLKDGNVVRCYDSMHAASLDGHFNSAILRVLRGELKTHHGFQWMYLDDYETLVNMSKNSVDTQED